jgi:endonuclease VIII
VPEGHTLHRLARDVQRRFKGDVVHVSSPQGRFAAGAALVDGATLRRAEAVGKHLLLDFGGGRHVHVHLGLFGRTTVADGPPPAPRGAVRMRMQNHSSYLDLRGATACEVVTGADRAALIARLGPDPLRRGADPGRAWARLSASTRPIGALLMDQSVVAGIGNVYRAEVLFRNRVDPHRPGNQLSRRSWLGIWSDLVALMPEGVRDNRIDTVRPEHTPEAMGRPPRRDDHGGEVYVYRRTGMPCWVCGARVRTELLAGRNLFWCGRCQRRG